MASIPAYASQFKYINLSFPFDNVLHVVLNRPPVNAVNGEYWLEYGAAFDRIAEDPTVRVVVLSSALEKVFSAGVDRAWITSTLQPPLSRRSDPARHALSTRTHVRDFQHAIGAPARAPQPVIAAVHGVAFGLALDALGAVDVRLAAADAAFSIKEVDVGLAPDIGTLARLPRLVGNLSLFHELALTGRVFGAQDALGLGLVSRVVPGSRDEVVRAALELAREIARKSPVAVVGVKRFISHALDHSTEDALEYQATWTSFALQSKDLIESAAAARRKQTITYDDLAAPIKHDKAKL
ncbi:ClpP/crotonase [Lactarius indigo]|nr:ClpP/crotonase [Lactarius indigo]